jgi:hypothetical protein
MKKRAIRGFAGFAFPAKVTNRTILTALPAHVGMIPICGPLPRMHDLSISCFVKSFRCIRMAYVLRYPGLLEPTAQPAKTLQEC